MRIGFASAKMRALCNDGRAMRRALGEGFARNIQRMLFMIDAAPTMADLPTAAPVSRARVDEDDPPRFSIGERDAGQILVQAYPPAAHVELDEIDSVCIMAVGGTV